MKNPTGMVPRTGLMDELDALADKRVIYVHAPAGYGKSVTAGLWLAHGSVPSATVPLDGYDNDLAEFCHRFCAALCALYPGNSVLEGLCAHPGFEGAPDEFLVRAVRLLPPNGAARLVIDDLHFVDGPEKHRLLVALLGRMPAGFRFMVLSRNAPPAAFGELLLKDEMALVPAEKLCFDPCEIQALFKSRKLPVTGQQAESLHRRTGGWAIGVTAVLLSGSADLGRKLPQGYLEDYIQAQVWGHWDTATQDFMLKTAFEDELSPGLCDALTGQAGSAQMLEGFLGAGAFISRDSQGSYHFHALFRDFLLRQAQGLGGDFRKAQLRAAGEWYLGQQDFYRAVERFADAGEHGGIARCFDLLEVLDRGGFVVERILPAIHQSLDTAILEEYPFLLYMMAYAAYMEGRAGDMAAYADGYYAQYPRIVARTPELAHNILFLKAFDFRTSLHQLLAEVAGMPAMPELKENRGTVTQNMPLFHRSFRDFSEFAVPGAPGDVGALQSTLGGLMGAELAPLLDCLVGGLLYEQGHLTKAHSLALSANAKLQPNSLAETKLCAMVLLADTNRALWQYDEAALVMDRLGALIEADHAFSLSYNYAACRCRLALENGDTASAEAWLSKHGAGTLDPVNFYHLYGFFATARACITLGSYDRAIITLKRVRQLAETYRRPLDIIEADVLLAVAFWKKKRGSQAEAMVYLEAAVLAAEPYGYVQVFAGEGADIVSMLYRLQSRAIRSDYDGPLNGSYVKMLHLRAVAHAGHARGLSGGRAETAFTPRQKKVMALLCEGRSYRQIADELGIKFTTVRSHIELIYKKLDVPTATEAVVKIKELGILDG